MNVCNPIGGGRWSGSNRQTIAEDATRKEAAATREALLDAAERVFREAAWRGRRSRKSPRPRVSPAAPSTGISATKPSCSMRCASGPRCRWRRCSTRPAAAAADDPLGTLRGLAVLGPHASRERSARAGRVRRRLPQVRVHGGSGAGRAPSARGRRRLPRQVSALIEEAIARGQLPADCDPRLAAQMLESFMVGVMHEWVQNPQSYDLRASGSRVHRLPSLAGLAASPPRRARRTPRASRARRGDRRAHVR